MNRMYTLYVSSYSYATIHWQDCCYLKQHGGKAIIPRAQYYVEGVSMEDALEEARTTGLEIRICTKCKPGE